MARQNASFGADMGPSLKGPDPPGGAWYRNIGSRCVKYSTQAGVIGKSYERALRTVVAAFVVSGFAGTPTRGLRILVRTR